MRNYALGTVNTLLRHLIQLVIKITENSLNKNLLIIYFICFVQMLCS